MKKNQTIFSILRIAAFGAILALLPGCKDPKNGASTEEGQENGDSSEVVENPTVKLVFVPSNEIESTKEAGRFQKNTFYWSNLTNNINGGPKIVETEQGPALELQGIQVNTGDKKSTILTLYRAFNVPKNASKAEIRVVANQTYNSWVDKQPTRYISNIQASSFKDGAEAAIQRISFERNRKDQEKILAYEIPLGAQQLIIKIEADNATTWQILDCHVSFPK